jgi:hypothetical protein
MPERSLDTPSRTTSDWACAAQAAKVAAKAANTGLIRICLSPNPGMGRFIDLSDDAVTREGGAGAPAG